MALHVTLTGAHVKLEPLQRRHEDALWEVAQDERIWRWMRVRGDQSRVRFRSYVDEVLAHALGFATFVDGALLGATSYANVRERDKVVEIGHTWLAPAAWGTGANAEAKYLLMAHAFEREAFKRVEFKTDALNERARAALESLPATFEGIARKHMIVRDGDRRDSAWYAVIDDDWRVVKANLERRLAAHAS